MQPSKTEASYLAISLRLLGKSNPSGPEGDIFSNKDVG